MSASETEYYSPGDVIYAGKDFAHVIYQKYQTEYCDYCCTQNLAVKSCSRCRCVSYCNKECQKSAWSEHKLECQYLFILQSKQWADEVLLVIRVIRKVKKGIGKNFSEKVGLQTITFDQLPSFSVSNSYEDCKTYLHVVTCNTQNLLSLHGLQLSYQDVYDFTSKVFYNSAALKYDKEYGMYLCLGKSFFQRRCMPNAVDILNKNLIHEIRATQKIPKTHNLKNVFLPIVDLVDSFCPIHNIIYSYLHFENQCGICMGIESPFVDVSHKNFILDLVVQFSDFHRLILSNQPVTPDVRKSVDSLLRQLVERFSKTHLIRIKLLVWRVLLDHENLFIVKHWERSLIHLIKNLYGEKSYELFTVYYHLTAIYASYGKFKIAKFYKAERDKLGSLYFDKPPGCKDEVRIEEALEKKHVVV